MSGDDCKQCCEHIVDCRCGALSYFKITYNDEELLKLRQRVEDLGRLMVMLDDILEMELFEKIKRSIWENQESQPIIERYMVEGVQERLYECLEICKGYDYLNEEKN